MARRRFVGRSGPRREFSWFDIPPAALVLNVAGGTIYAQLTAAELARRPFTVMRTHITAHIESDQLAASEFQIAALGLAVVSEQAAAAGVGSVPTPVTDDDSDAWFVHKWVMNSIGFGDATGFSTMGSVYEIDSKAMRKVNDGDDVVIVGEFSATGSGLILSIAGRLLIKNH